jgi:predicted dithiol-disulfide oxidoreductase (DUF899 family)
MEKHRIVPHAEWVAARKALLAEEKEFNRLRDRLSEKRRNLPWERVEKDYVFDGPSGKARLAQLFAGKSQLLVYHFMFDPDWEAGCKSCSFWADNFSNIPVHLKHRDVSLVAISRAPLDKIEAFRKRMGWSFPWYSAHGSDFNFDYHVSFRPEDRAQGEVEYNYRPIKTTMSELPGISVFFRDEDGAVYHTYSTYARGLDMLNGAYHMLDLVPKGRDEEGRGQFWVRLHDRYED